MKDLLRISFINPAFAHTLLKRNRFSRYRVPGPDPNPSVQAILRSDRTAIGNDSAADDGAVVLHDDVGSENSTAQLRARGDAHARPEDRFFHDRIRTDRAVVADDDGTTDARAGGDAYAVS